ALLLAVLPGRAGLLAVVLLLAGLGAGLAVLAALGCLTLLGRRAAAPPAALGTGRQALGGLFVLFHLLFLPLLGWRFRLRLFAGRGGGLWRGCRLLLRRAGQGGCFA